MANPVDPPAAPVKPVEISYAEPADLTLVRDFVRTEAAALGLPVLRADLLTVAVSELATNTLQHTAGGGLVRVFAERGRVCCEVVDHGVPPRFGRTMPGPHEVRGRGLAIVERICDEVSVANGSAGTVVRLGMLV